MAFFTVEFMAGVVNLIGPVPPDFGTICRGEAWLQPGFPQRDTLPGHPW